MKPLLRAFASPEITGLACGLFACGIWHWFAIRIPPVTLFVGFAVAASLGGLVCATISSRTSLEKLQVARRGAIAGICAITSFIVCASLVALIKFGFFSFGHLLAMATSFIPAALVGTIVTVIGMKLLQLRQAKSEPVEFTEAPKWCRWTIRGLLGTGLVVAIITALLPPSYGQAWLSNSAQWKTTAPAPPFHYSTPEALKAAPPVAWKLSASREIGRFLPGFGLSFSEDQTIMAGVLDAGSIVVRDLHSDSSRVFAAPPFPVHRFALSPDGTRVFVVMQGDPRRISVGIVATGEFIALPQPKKHAVPDSSVTWCSDHGVLFWPSSGDLLMLDLHSLEFDPPEMSPKERDRVSRERSYRLPTNSRWEFAPHNALTMAELPETEGASAWAWDTRQVLMLTDRLRLASRIFPEIGVESNDAMLGVEDGSKLLRFRNGNLSVFYFDTRPVPPLRWKITLPHPPDKMEEKDAALRALARGELALLLYSPLINPLTNQTVGPDRERPKAIFRVRRWEGREAEIWSERSADPYTPGDVFADFFTFDPRLHLLKFDQRHRWWTIATEPLPDASEIARIPTGTEMSKQKSEAIAAEPEKPAQPDPPRVPLPASAAPAAQPPPLPTPEPEPTPVASNQAVQKEVEAFVVAHHAKATQGDVAGLAADYAPKINYLNKGTVDPNFILRDETDYHRTHKFVREKVEPGIRVKIVGEGVAEAEYTMTNVWERNDGKRGGGSFQLKLILNSNEEGWRITEQLATKLK